MSSAVFFCCINSPKPQDYDYDDIKQSKKQKIPSFQRLKLKIFDFFGGKSTERLIDYQNNFSQSRILFIMVGIHAKIKYGIDMHVRKYSRWCPTCFQDVSVLTVICHTIWQVCTEGADGFLDRFPWNHWTAVMRRQLTLTVTPTVCSLDCTHKPSPPHTDGPKRPVCTRSLNIRCPPLRFIILMHRKLLRHLQQKWSAATLQSCGKLLFKQSRLAV